MRSFSLRVTAALALLLAPANQQLHSQILYGSARGAMSRDASDAAIAPAPRSITNPQTNQSRQAVTNETGGYSVNALEPGTYTVRVTKEGFSAHTTSNVTVSINSVTRLDVRCRWGR